jgi:glutathione S-transferase
MKLFYKPGACSLASHITLQESGKDFTLNGVDLMKKRLENGDDFFAINPKGQVPALLLDDGTLLTEGVAIMQFLADAVPDRQLLAPTGSVARYKTLEWLNYIATELHKGFTPLFRPDTPEVGTYHTNQGQVSSGCCPITVLVARFILNSRCAG